MKNNSSPNLTDIDVQRRTNRKSQSVNRGNAHVRIDESHSSRARNVDINCLDLRQAAYKDQRVVPAVRQKTRYKMIRLGRAKSRFTNLGRVRPLGKILADVFAARYFHAK